MSSANFCAAAADWDDDTIRRSHEIAKRVTTGQIDRIRYAWVDQHGLVRGKTLLGERARRALNDGVNIVGTTMLKDTSDKTAWPVFEPGGGLDSADFEGASDLTLIPDPNSFVELPWSAGTGWILCEAHLSDGRVAPFDTRAKLRRLVADMAEHGWLATIGLEVEFHIFRLINQAPLAGELGRPSAPPVELLNSGYRLLTEQRYDEVEPILELLRKPMLEMGLAIDSIEVELGPSQFEFVFAHTDAMRAADRMVLFRHAAKQILRRHGLHASFMCLPDLPNLMASGWHLHQSISDRAGRNLFAEPTGGLSLFGQSYLAGLLDHAEAACAFSTPTINGYRRFRPNALAPDRITWGRDNRGAMLRLIEGRKPDETRLENRTGEPAANPYLYIASQLVAGVDGCRRELRPPPPVDRPYASDHPALPRTLSQALEALSGNAAFEKGFGTHFIDYYLHIKRAELARFQAEVTAWEHREYFDMF